MGERLVLGLAGARKVLGGPTAVSVASAGSRSAPNTTALQLVRVAPCDLGAVSRAPEIASTIALMYSQRLDRFLDNQKALNSSKKRLTVAKVQCALASGPTHTSPKKGSVVKPRPMDPYPRPETAHEGIRAGGLEALQIRQSILIGLPRCAMRRIEPECPDEAVNNT